MKSKILKKNKKTTASDILTKKRPVAMLSKVRTRVKVRLVPSPKPRHRGANVHFIPMVISKEMLTHKVPNNTTRIETNSMEPKTFTSKTYSPSSSLSPWFPYLKIFIKRRLVLGTITSSLVAFIVSAPLMLAFEAHVVNVTATLVQIEPPVISSKGGSFGAPIDITIDDTDPDATHIFYTNTPGNNPSIAPDPVCGDLSGGLKSQGPINISDDRVIKAIACDSEDSNAHNSIITTEIYRFNIIRHTQVHHQQNHSNNNVGTTTPPDTVNTPVNGHSETTPHTQATTTEETLGSHIKTNQDVSNPDTSSTTSTDNTNASTTTEETLTDNVTTPPHNEEVTPPPEEPTPPPFENSNSETDNATNTQTQ